jgi:hypothetical protein
VLAEAPRDWPPVQRAKPTYTAGNGSLQFASAYQCFRAFGAAKSQSDTSRLGLAAPHFFERPGRSHDYLCTFFPDFYGGASPFSPLNLLAGSTV